MSLPPPAEAAHKPEGGCCADCEAGPPVTKRSASSPAGRLLQWHTHATPTTIRLGLIGLSTGGVVVAITLWSVGYGHLAPRILAGVVLLAAVILLI